MTQIPVLITCYNKKRYIADAVWSALANTDAIFVVDDCSTDGSWEILLDLVAEHGPALRAVQTPQNAGSTFATIAVMQAARDAGFEFATLLDGDDVLAPNAVAHFAEVLDQTGADAVYGSVVRSPDRDRRGDACAIDAYTVDTAKDPLSTWLDRPRATTAVCGRICVMMQDLSPEARIQDHQLGLSIHRNSKAVAYSSGKTHYCSLAEAGENLALDQRTGWTSAVVAYQAHWRKIHRHPKFRKYQRRAFSCLTKTRKLAIFPAPINIFLNVLTPIKVLMPSAVRHFLLTRLARYL